MSYSAKGDMKFSLIITPAKDTKGDSKVLCIKKFYNKIKMFILNNI